MTYSPTYDRTDWRALSTRTLIEAARESGHELAIALGERAEELAEEAAELAELRAQLEELDQRCDALREELQAFLDAEAGA